MTLLVGGRAVIDGNLQVGFFSVLVFMTQRLLWPLTTLGETFDLYQRANVPAGETHAVVGLTGAGKSTIVKLLLRLYDATAGRVTVDGTDVRELSTCWSTAS